MLHQTDSSLTQSTSEVRSVAGAVPFEQLPPCPATATPGMIYGCPVCGKEFYYKNDFRRHYMTHSGEKPFMCPFCPYKARFNSSIKKHCWSRHRT
ncbi:hypothetical protein HAZT_HAZT004253 [Hyalella azteca]|uniref:C2H2-type domain-containing protein n=1 Tax=Hyalella azteca TaxID=294128 RepID=A0A6A0GTH7_HYAAZ|nr:hypothetical protein HAZT_HAZT004253 [Hyalella azteca]